jgi:hypothetical protein
MFFVRPERATCVVSLICLIEFVIAEVPNVRRLIWDVQLLTDLRLVEELCYRLPRRTDWRRFELRLLISVGRELISETENGPRGIVRDCETSWLVLDLT